MSAAKGRITEAIGAAIQAGEIGNTGVGMPAGWVLVANYHDEHGQVRTVVLADVPPQATLGLLDVGQLWCREQVRRRLLPPPT